MTVKWTARKEREMYRLARKVHRQTATRAEAMRMRELSREQRLAEGAAA